MAVDPPGDLTLAPLGGEPHPLRAWLTQFQLAIVVLDPYTHQSAWILDTAGRILRTFDQADCRVAWLVTCSPAEARQFLGPWADEILTFTDPDRAVVKGIGLETLPAFVHIASDGSVVSAVEGWDPAGWRQATDTLARMMSWRGPVIPAAGDPAPYEGTPALG